ncbi:MAG TPA: hypothetical protein VGK32_11065 [Vicinamibacterales bacterium]|jgi:hypothetical protein
MNIFLRISATCCMLTLAAAASAGQVKLEIREGLVTLDAKDASIREVLAEWGRVGQTRIVNAERAPGTPMTLQLSGVPERAALEVLLRTAAGYVAAPRTVAQSTGSVFDRIIVMPGSRPAVGTPATTAAPARPSAANQLPAWGGRDRMQPPPIIVDDPDEPTVNPQPQQPMAAQPGMLTGPAPYQMPQGGQTGPPFATPNASPYGQTPYPPPPVSQPATRPGMPTTPVRPGGPGGPGGGPGDPGQGGV